MSSSKEWSGYKTKCPNPTGWDKCPGTKTYKAELCLECSKLRQSTKQRVKSIIKQYGRNIRFRLTDEFDVHRWVTENMEDIRPEVVFVIDELLMELGEEVIDLQTKFG